MPHWRAAPKNKTEQEKEIKKAMLQIGKGPAENRISAF